MFGWVSSSSIGNEPPLPLPAESGTRRQTYPARACLDHVMHVHSSTSRLSLRSPRGTPVQYQYLCRPHAAPFRRPCVPGRLFPDPLGRNVIARSNQVGVSCVAFSDRDKGAILIAVLAQNLVDVAMTLQMEEIVYDRRLRRPRDPR